MANNYVEMCADWESLIIDSPAAGIRTSRRNWKWQNHTKQYIHRSVMSNVGLRRWYGMRAHCWAPSAITWMPEKQKTSRRNTFCLHFNFTPLHHSVHASIDSDRSLQTSIQLQSGTLLTSTRPRWMIHCFLCSVDRPPAVSSIYIPD